MSSARPYSDSGGYEAMLRHFMATGRVDYMKWSQPTFIGLLPIAVPWARAFGDSTASLQWLSVAFSLALLAGVWAFSRRTIGAWGALWIAASVLILHEALSSSVAFMTDVPYAAYLVGFLLAHRELESRYSNAEGRGGTSKVAGLWILWGAMFLLSALTRSFSLALVPVFVLQWLLARRSPGLSAFALRCVLLGIGLSVLSIVIVRLLGVNGFTPREITAIPQILGGDRGRLDVRALLSGVLGLAVATLPALLMWSPARRGAGPQEPGHSRGVAGSVVVGAVALGLGLMFWRKGALSIVMSLPQLPTLATLLALAQVALGAVAVPLLVLVLARGLRDALAKTRDMADGGWRDAAYPHTSGVLWAIAVAHFALMPILLHPLPRHLMPAGIAVLLLVAMQSTAFGTAPMASGGISKLKPGLASALCVLLLGGVAWGVSAERAVNQRQFDMASDLNRRGTPLSQIAGGWAFFCARDLEPGLPAKAYLWPQDYVSRFTRLEERAPYMVTSDVSAKGREVLASTVPGAPTRTVRVLRR